MVRTGDLFEGFLSENGTDWYKDLETTIQMNDVVYLGLCMTSHTSGEMLTATYDNVQVSGGTDVGPADLNGDGVVGWADLFLLLDEWLVEIRWPY
jgi:hypothetical protein